MASVAFGPALAGFPAFPLLPLDALADPASLPPEVLAGIQQTFQALNFQFTATSFSFELNSEIFGRPGAFDFGFLLTGDFASLAALPPAQLFAAFNPTLAGNFLVRFDGADTRNLVSGDLVVGVQADSLGPQVTFLQLFGTLLDPRNYTQDLLATFTGDLGQFDTLDLSAFANGVISARPNGPTITTEGTISRPDGSFVDSAYGIVSFNGEVLSLGFSQIIGGAGDDILAAGALAATVSGGGGDDLLIGSAGADSLEGRDGTDVLMGGRGNDTLEGGSGDDLLLGQGGSDVLTGGFGADTFIIGRGAGMVTTITDLTLGVDRLLIEQFGARDLRGLVVGTTGTGDVSLTFGPAAARQTLLLQDVEGPSAASPGAWLQALLPGTLPTLIAVPGGGKMEGAAGDDMLLGQAGADRLRGGAGADTLFGGEGDDRLVGQDGDDVLLGGAGEDALRGGDGDDVLDGGDGADTLNGGAGFDVISGGFGADVFVLQRQPGTHDRITDFELGTDRFDLSAILGGRGVTAVNFADYVQVTPLGPTELTGFIAVDRDGAGGPGGFEVVAQIDGTPFAIVGDVAASQLGLADFIL